LYINQYLNLIMITNLIKYSLINKLKNSLNQLINKSQLKDSKLYKMFKIKVITY